MTEPLNERSPAPLAGDRASNAQLGGIEHRDPSRASGFDQPPADPKAWRAE